MLLSHCLRDMIKTSSSFSRVIDHILSENTKEWGILSAEMGSEVNWPEYKAKLTQNGVLDKFQPLVQAVETRLTNEKIDPQKATTIKFTPAENNIRTRMLADDLAKTGFIRMYGVWDAIPEKSFLLPNVSHAAIKRLSEIYSQFAYVYGKNGNPGHYWVIETGSGNVLQDGDPAVDLRNVGGPNLSREERKQKHKEVMDEGQRMRHFVNEPSKDNYSEYGLRGFKLHKAPGQETTGTPPPAPAGNIEPQKHAALYYSLKRDAAKYLCRSDGVYQGGYNAFFVNGPDVEAMTVLLPISEEDVSAALDTGTVKRV